MEKYRKIYQMLEDDISKDIYMGVLNWRITENAKYMEEMIRNYYP